METLVSLWKNMVTNSAMSCIHDTNFDWTVNDVPWYNIQNFADVPNENYPHVSRSSEKYQAEVLKHSEHYESDDDF